MSSLASPRYPIVQLATGHDVRGFTCGSHPGAADIDEYLKGSALAEQAAGVSQVWIATEARAATADDVMAAYFTLSPLSIPLTPAVLATLGLESVPYRAVGGYLLGRLGVAARLQRQGIGSALIAAAIRIARQARTEVGGAFLAIDPENDKLLAWYAGLGFGFRRLDPARRRIILKL